MENTLLVTDVLWVLAAIVAVGTFVTYITKPYKKLQEQLDKQAQTINELSNNIKAQQHLVNSSLKVQLLLIQHIVYGNHTENLKAELANLQETIIDLNS